MALRQVIDILDILDTPAASGEAVAALIRPHDGVDVDVTTVGSEKGSTDFLTITIPGSRGKTAGGDAPTLGIIGRLGGLGARPARIGFVSDGDGAAAALAAALKLARAREAGDVLPGDVIVATHVCPDAPTKPHTPVEFMGSPVDMSIMNAREVHPDMDAILSIDTTKGNRIVNHRGLAISAPVHRGYVLAYSEDLLRIIETVTGRPAVGLPISTQDLTPYGNGVHHINSILQPAAAARVPVVGLAITTETTVPGSATGASHETDIALAARFAIETAKEFGAGTAAFIDPEEVARLVDLYGDLSFLYRAGRS